MNYKKYELKLITLSPVHVGAGEVKTSKEFIYEKGTYYFPEMGKLYLILQQKNPQLGRDFENFLGYMPKNPKNAKRLIDFLKEKQIRERDFGGFKIAETGEEVEKDNRKSGNLNEVHLFMRNAYGQAYIPGSSLKGALRCIFESEYFAPDKQIPWGAKKGVPFNDIFNNIRVEDSIPIGQKNMAIVRKIDYSLEKNTLKPIPLYREALRPLQMINFKITAIDDGIELMDKLLELSQKRYQRYKDFYLNDQPQEYIQDNIPEYGILYLGAGSGLWTKFNLANKKNVVKILEKKQNIRNKKMRMKGKGALKLTRYPEEKNELGNKLFPSINNNDNYYEMGKCNFTLTEVK